MIEIIVYLLTATVITLAAVWVNDQKLRTTESGSGAGLRCLRIARKEAIALLAFGMAGGILLAEISQEWYEADRMQKMSVSFVNGWLLFAAWSDQKSRRVPNCWCLFGLGEAAIVLVVRLVIFHSSLTVFADSLLGALLASSILFAGAMLRRGGIGMGDVKVFFVLGLFFGTETVFGILLITLVAALAVGAVRIVRRKSSRKDRFPLCPFAYVALAVAVLGGL